MCRRRKACGETEPLDALVRRHQKSEPGTGDQGTLDGRLKGYATDLDPKVAGHDFVIGAHLIDAR